VSDLSEIGAVAAVAVALGVDLLAGDPPNRFHPVAWMGHALGAGRARLGAGSPAWLLLAGTLLVVLVAAVAGAMGWAVGWLSARIGPVGAALDGLALATLLSLRGLAGAAREVQGALDRGDLAAARASVGFHLVSRPTDALSETQVASATVESVAENLTDSLVAPVFFYLLLGLPGAAAYRAINTADAVLGYRTETLEYFGKAAARLDDLLNLIPARIAALAIVLGAGQSRREAWRVLARDRGRTPSPNAGWTMAAMAGALGVTLEKPGVYRLGDGRPPGAVDVTRSLRVLTWSTALALGVLAAARMAFS
jgi:adenosylcobinamide-phosphate synthase